MKLVISLAVVIISQLSMAQSCPNLSGRWGLYTTNFNIVQEGCAKVTMAGAEPISNAFMATGKSQPVDGKFYEYTADADNYLPFIPPTEPRFARYKIKASYVKGALVIEQYLKSGTQWDFRTVREFTPTVGGVFYRVTGKDYVGRPWVFEKIVPKYKGY